MSTVVGILVAIALLLILVWLLNYATSVTQPRAPSEPPSGMLAMERKVSLTLTMLIAIGLFFTGYALVFEPARQASARERQQRDSIERAIASYTTFCYPCHGSDGTGAVVPGVDPPRIAPALNRPDFWATGKDLDEQRRIYDLLNKTIHRGRPNTPMPAWGRLDGGTLLDEQIHELVLMIMNGDRSMSARIEIQPEPGVHEYRVVDGTPWQIAHEQLNERFAQGAPTPIPASSLLGQAQQQGPPGQALFLQQPCAGCHTIQGLPGAAGTTGPELTHIGTVAAQRKPGMSAEDYIRESITNPTAFVVPGYQPVMPKLPLSDEQVSQLVEYLSSLK